MGLVAVGVRRLSVAPARVGPIKLMVRSLDVGRVAGYIDTLSRCGSDNLRSALIDFAHDHDIDI